MDVDSFFDDLLNDLNIDNAPADDKDQFGDFGEDDNLSLSDFQNQNAPVSGTASNRNSYNVAPASNTNAYNEEISMEEEEPEMDLSCFDNLGERKHEQPEVEYVAEVATVHAPIHVLQSAHIEPAQAAHVEYHDYDDDDSEASDSEDQHTYGQSYSVEDPHYRDSHPYDDSDEEQDRYEPEHPQQQYQEQYCNQHKDEEAEEARDEINYDIVVPRTKKNHLNTDDSGVRQSVLDMIDSLVIAEDSTQHEIQGQSLSANDQGQDNGVRESVFYMIDSLVSKDEVPEEVHNPEIRDTSLDDLKKLEAVKIKQQELEIIMAEAAREKKEQAQQKKRERELAQERLRQERLAQEAIDSALDTHRDHILQVRIQPYEDATVKAAHSLAAVIRNTKLKTEPYITLSQFAIKALSALLVLVKKIDSSSKYAGEIATSATLITETVKRLAVSTKNLNNHENDANKLSLRKDAFDAVVLMKDLRASIEHAIIDEYNQSL